MRHLRTNYGGSYKLIEMDFEFMSSRFVFKVEE